MSNRRASKASSPPPDIAKSDLFRQLGFGGEPSAYEDLLSAHGLSNPRKSRIAESKRNQVAAALGAGFMRVCARGDCSRRAPALAGERRITLAASQADCEVCGGSVNQSAVASMVATCRARGWKRLIIVGGSPASREELVSLVQGQLELRFVDGTVSHTVRQSTANMGWADRVVVWGSTQLDHKVSTLYRGPNVLIVRKRGIADLAMSLEQHARGGRAGPAD